VLEEIIGFYGADYPTFCEFASKSEPHNIIRVAPGSMTDRFVSEDIPFILVPWYELGLLAGVEARMMRSMIDITSTMNGIDYMREGRSLASLGVNGMSRDDIVAFCGSGRAAYRPGVGAEMGAIPAPVATAGRAHLVPSGAQ